MQQRQLLTVTLAASVWLCPLWLGPTAIVPALLWGGAGLGGLLLLDATAAPQAQPAALQKLLLALLLSLGLMIAWRSSNLQNTLAAALSLVGIGFAATLSAKVDPVSPAKLMAWGWLVAGLINAAFGLIQYFGWTAEPLRVAFGFLRQRNQLATLCNIALLALLYLWHQKQLRTYPSICACMLLTAALAATTSRAGLLEFLVVAAVLVTQKNFWRAAVLIALGYIFFAWMLPTLSHLPETIASRVSGTAEGSTFQDGRLLLWSNTLTIINQHPLLGVGWREIALSLHLTDFGASMRFPDQADNAHNLPLQLAAELGVPFALLWCGALLWLILRNKPWQSRTPEQLLGWGILTVIGIHSLLEYPLWYAPFQMTVGFAIGLVFVNKSSQRNVPASHIWKGFAGIALLIFVAYAAFDYHRVRQLFIPDSERSALYRSHTVAHAESSWLFAAQVRYAKLTTSPITADNAQKMWLLGKDVMHFSPEPRVLESLIAAGSYLAPTDASIAAELSLYRRQLAAILASRAAFAAAPLK